MNIAGICVTMKFIFSSRSFVKKGSCMRNLFTQAKICVSKIVLCDGYDSKGEVREELQNVNAHHSLQ